ncbi:MAG TPA: right-handed parallel beta-helix repeat-containing protein, partial [Clostridia bacterium]|nr:right-handed parallel beta-helix repeat-containing protein [Clostridia bacterium]
WKVPWMGTYGGGWQRKPTHEDLTTLRLKPGSAGTQFDPLNAEITIYHEWDESLVSVQSWDAALGTIRFNQESGHPPGAFGQQTCVIWNTLDGMTKPGQWLLDRRNCKVVYWPRNGETSSNLRVVYPTTEAIFRIVGSSAQPVRKVVIKGLTFSVANTPLKTGGFGAFAFDGAITAKHVEDCQFTGLLVHQVAGQGLKLSHAFRGEVSASEIRDTGAGGILCEDGTGLHVTRNFVHDIGRLYPSAIGITCSGLTNRVDGNRLQNTPYVGLTCDGDGARIENNRFQRVMQELHDGAAIYLGGTNHIVRGNHCRDIGNSTTDRRHAYYLDEMVRNTIVEGNLAVNCPVPLHNHIASDNRIIGNVFIHDGEMRLAFYRCDRHELDRNLVVANGKIEVYRPEAVTHWNKNLFFSRSGEILGYPVERYSAGSPQPLRLPGVELGPDPRVKEVAEGTIVWPKDSPATRLGISQLDVRSAGRDAGCPVIKGRKQVTRPSGFEAVK